MKDEDWIYLEIVMRSHNELIKNDNDEKHLKKKWFRPHSASPSYDRFLCFDTETKDIPTLKYSTQALHFGSFILMNTGAIEMQGVFYNPNLIEQNELQIVNRFCQKNPITKVYTLTQFIENIFYPICYSQQVPCITYNSAFDFSRLAKSWSPANGKFSNGFLLKLSDKKSNPPIRIKNFGSIGNKLVFQKRSYSNFDGYFVDAARLSAILFEQKHVSLEEAVWKLNKVKLDKKQEWGKLTEKFLIYNLTDTIESARLFIKLKSEFLRFGLPNLPLHRIWSSASVSKAMLSALNIKPIKEKGELPPTLNGKVWQCYFGGRVENFLTWKAVEVSALDVTSMYPSMAITLGLYEFLIAEKIIYEDATEEVKKFVDNITLEDLKNPETWKQMNCIVEIQADHDILPVRAKYDEKSDNHTVALNELTSEKSIYYGLPSVIFSRLKVGKSPKILSAIKFRAIGKQKDLRKVKILGTEIDPTKDNIFKFLVEEKQRSKINKDGRHKQLKITVNSLYGLFLQLDRESEEKKDVMIYSGNAAFSEKKRFEKPGKYYNPIISTLITDGAKLLLGTAELILDKYDKMLVYCDTDSCYIPPEHAAEIKEFFNSINPYNKTLIPELLKTDYEKIWLLALNPKRYTLFHTNAKGEFEIVDDDDKEGYSLHGIGHLTDPFNSDGKEQHWHKQIWTDILSLYYGKITEAEFLDKYRDYYAISQFTVSTKHLMDRFEKLNENKSYDEMIKPFNFMLIGFGTDKNVKPIGPFIDNKQAMVHSEFVNYKNGEVMKGEEYFKSLADELWHYIHKREAKFEEGENGVMKRRHIVADRFCYIGKEGDKIHDNTSGLSNPDVTISYDPTDVDNIVISHKWNEIKHLDISKSEFYLWRKQIKEGKHPKYNDESLKKLLKLR